MRGERAAFFGNELRQQIGLSSGDQLLHLFLGNFALQDVFAREEWKFMRRAEEE